MVVSNIFYFHPYLGMISNLTSIFFKWVGSTTNQIVIEYHRLERSTDICQVMVMSFFNVFEMFSLRDTRGGHLFLSTKRPAKWLRAGQRIRMCRDVALAMVR